MAMDERTFWRILLKLDWRKLGDDDAVIEPAVAALAEHEVPEIERFSAILAEKLYALDTEAHAREIGEYAYTGDEDDRFSVDAFLYARCVVVANGLLFYLSVLSDPKQMPKDMELEALLSIAPAAYERKTGRELQYEPPHSYETFSNEAGWRGVK